MLDRPNQQKQLERTTAEPSHGESEGKRLSPPAFQLMASNGAGAPPVQQKASSGGLPVDLVNGFAASTGHDLSDVNVHSNSDKPSQVGALAYAQGNDIHLGAGQEQHLAHEAAHIVQQREGRVQANTQVGGKPVNDQVSLESEADQMGSKAMQMKGASLGTAPCANGPVSGVTQAKPAIQRKLKLAGKKTNMDKVVKLINKNIVGEVASIDKDGLITLTTKTSKVTPTKEQEAFLKALKIVLDDPQEVLINVESGNEKYLNGDFGSSTLDIKDISMASATEGGTAQAALIHEIYEQYQKQAKGQTFNPAHKEARKIENEVNGAIRYEGPEKDVKWDEKTGEIIEGKFLDGYRYPDGREVITTYTYKNRKLVSVNSKETKKPKPTTEEPKTPQKVPK